MRPDRHEQTYEESINQTGSTNATLKVLPSCRRLQGKEVSINTDVISFSFKTLLVVIKKNTHTQVQNVPEVLRLFSVVYGPRPLVLFVSSSSKFGFQLKTCSLLIAAICIAAHAATCSPRSHLKLWETSGEIQIVLFPHYYSRLRRL